MSDQPDLEGKPEDAPDPYPGQERFSDGQFQIVSDDDWTAELALTATRAMDLPTREEQVARLRDAIDDELLPDSAIEALIEDGWTELQDDDEDENA